MKHFQYWLIALSLGLVFLAGRNPSGSPVTSLLRSQVVQGTQTVSESTAQYIQLSTNEPVLLIHGIADSGKDSVDCNAHNPWGDLKSVLDGGINNGAYPIDGQTANWSYTNLISIGYYSGDTDCDIQLAPNNLNRPQAETNNPFLDISSVLPDIEHNCHIARDDQVNKASTSIETLSCMVAWYIWDTFSSKGLNVRVVAHSMGGLMTRYALYASHNTCVQQSLLGPFSAPCLNFPPALHISNVVTIDTPHGGVAFNTVCNACLEGDEMVANGLSYVFPHDNNFMNNLYANAQNPQGIGGTKWMLMGGHCVPAQDGISCFTNSYYMQAWLKADYTCDAQVPGPTPSPQPDATVIPPSTRSMSSTTCYNHGGYLNDSTQYWGNNVLDNHDPNHMGTTVAFCTNCATSTVSIDDTFNMPHSLYMVKYGLLGIDPRQDPYQGTFALSPTPNPSPTTVQPTPSSTPNSSFSSHSLFFAENHPWCNQVPDSVDFWNGDNAKSTQAVRCLTLSSDHTGSSTIVLTPYAQQTTEVDLQSINGDRYDDPSGTLTASVLLNFSPTGIQPDKDHNVWAGFNIDTPKNGSGGYYFEFSALGNWMYQQVLPNGNFQTIASGTDAAFVNNPGTQEYLSFTIVNNQLTLGLPNQTSNNPTFPSPAPESAYSNNPWLIGFATQAVEGSANIIPVGYSYFQMKSGACVKDIECNPQNEP